MIQKNDSQPQTVYYIVKETVVSRITLTSLNFPGCGRVVVGGGGGVSLGTLPIPAPRLSHPWREDALKPGGGTRKNFDGSVPLGL